MYSRLDLPGSDSERASIAAQSILGRSHGTVQIVQTGGLTVGDPKNKLKFP